MHKPVTDAVQRSKGVHGGLVLSTWKEQSNRIQKFRIFQSAGGHWFCSKRGSRRAGCGWWEPSGALRRSGTVPCVGRGVTRRGSTGRPAPGEMPAGNVTPRVGIWHVPPFIWINSCRPDPEGKHGCRIKRSGRMAAPEGCSEWFLLTAARGHLHNF